MTPWLWNAWQGSWLELVLAGVGLIVYLLWPLRPSYRPPPLWRPCLKALGLVLGLYLLRGTWIAPAVFFDHVSFTYGFQFNPLFTWRDALLFLQLLVAVLLGRETLLRGILLGPHFSEQPFRFAIQVGACLLLALTEMVLFWENSPNWLAPWTLVGLATLDAVTAGSLFVASRSLLPSALFTALCLFGERLLNASIEGPFAAKTFAVPIGAQAYYLWHLASCALAALAAGGFLFYKHKKS